MPHVATLNEADPRDVGMDFPHARIAKDRVEDLVIVSVLAHFIGKETSELTSRRPTSDKPCRIGSCSLLLHSSDGIS
jgi:hypothetical protein